MESQPQNLNSGIILKTFTYEYVTGTHELGRPKIKWKKIKKKKCHELEPLAVEPHEMNTW